VAGGGGDQGNAPSPLAYETGGPFGFIEITVEDTTGTAQTGGLAFFAAQGFNCPPVQVQSCRLARCPSNLTSPTFLGAGTLTAVGPSSTLTMNPPAPNGEYSGSLAGALWSGGETIPVAATGGDVPAFTLTPVAPLPLDVSAPVLGPPDDGGTLTLSASRLSDLGFAWSGGGSGWLLLTLTSSPATSPDGGSGYDVIECVFDAPSATGVLPSALLQQVAPGPGWTLAVFSMGAATGTAGSYAIIAPLEEPATYGGQAVPTVSVTLQ
jgi:hypothetical protein